MFALTSFFLRATPIPPCFTSLLDLFFSFVILFILSGLFSTKIGLFFSLSFFSFFPNFEFIPNVSFRVENILGEYARSCMCIHLPPFLNTRTYNLSLSFLLLYSQQLSSCNLPSFPFLSSYSRYHSHFFFDNWFFFGICFFFKKGDEVPKLV